MYKKMCLIILAFLVACTPTVTEVNETATPSPNMLSFEQVLEEFSALDAELNTSWHEEKIPEKIIPLQALEQWTRRVKLLEQLTEPESIAHHLVKARIAMLKTESAYLLGAQIGEKGAVGFTGTKENITATIRCENKEETATAAKLYNLSYKSWLEFVHHMDYILQNSQKGREVLGIDDKRMPFYYVPFDDITQIKIDAIVTGLGEQCGYTLNLQD